MPGWYVNLLAADRLGISVIELYKLPSYWRDRALLARQAENEGNVMWHERQKALREAGFD